MKDKSGDIIRECTSQILLAIALQIDKEMMSNT